MSSRHVNDMRAILDVRGFSPSAVTRNTLSWQVETRIICHARRTAACTIQRIRANQAESPSMMQQNTCRHLVGGETTAACEYAALQCSSPPFNAIDCHEGAMLPCTYISLPDSTLADWGDIDRPAPPETAAATPPLPSPKYVTMTSWCPACPRARRLMWSVLAWSSLVVQWPCAWVHATTGDWPAGVSCVVINFSRHAAAILPPKPSQVPPNKQYSAPLIYACN
jgi:hypothetical protein